jgi:hypothetical protein
MNDAMNPRKGRPYEYGMSVRRGKTRQVWEQVYDNGENFGNDGEIDFTLTCAGAWKAEILHS